MSKYTKILLGIVVIVVVVVILVVNSNKSTENSVNTEKFKIGIIIPMSGPAANFGEASKKAVDLVVSKMSESLRSGIEIVYGDDQLDTKQTASVAQKLIDVDHVSAIVAWSSPTSVVASAVAENKGVPMIGLGNSPEINANKKWVIRYMLGPVEQAKAIEEKLLRGKYKKIAIVWNQSDGPKSVHYALIKELSNNGYEIVADESVTKTENDFKTSITKIRVSKPDVVVAYISPQVGIFAKQAKDLNLKIPLVSGPPFEFVEQIKVAQGGLDNQLFAGSDNLDFVDEYFKTYNSYPTVAGDYLFDAITRLSNIPAESRSNEKIMDYLRKDFRGVAGAYTYKSDGSFDVLQIVKKWNGKEFIKVQ
jgi:branched-chain amino acid transport system substrate-binding protein